MLNPASMNMDGPHCLAFERVDAVVRPAQAGVFALGYLGADGAFYVNYIGRSDDDVRRRLLDFIGADVSFKFRTVASGREAFLRECELYHAFRPPANRLHPARPQLSGWICPQCQRL